MEDINLSGMYFFLTTLWNTNAALWAYESYCHNFVTSLIPHFHKDCAMNHVLSFNKKNQLKHDDKSIDYVYDIFEFLNGC